MNALLRGSAVAALTAIMSTSAFAGCLVNPSATAPASNVTSMSTENSSQVYVTGGCIDGAQIGQNKSAAGTFSVLSAPFATLTVAPTNQTGISGATAAAVMLGLSKAASHPSLMTPIAGNNVFLMITGNVVVGTSGDGVLLQASYGTSTLPANNGTLAGTQLGNPVEFINAASTTETVPFAVSGVIAAPTLGTQLWFDLAVENVTGGTATVTNVTVTAFEF